MTRNGYVNHRLIKCSL